MPSQPPETPTNDVPSDWDAPYAYVALPAATRALYVGKTVPPGVRDQYIADRFPGVAEGGRDLENVARVIGGARLYFDEGKTDRALELLDLAIQQCPFDEPLRLARLEIVFLLRDAPLFTLLATEFHAVRGAGLAWCEITRLGRVLAPAEPLFGAKQGERTFERYGPWPQLPNWLNASWDLTSEVLAADYHRLMATHAPAHGTQTLPAPPRTLR